MQNEDALPLPVMTYTMPHPRLTLIGGCGRGINHVYLIG